MLSRPRHSARVSSFPQLRLSRIHLPAPLRSTRITGLPRYYERSDSCHRHPGDRSPWFICPAFLAIPSPTTWQAPAPLSHATHQLAGLPPFHSASPPPVPAGSRTSMAPGLTLAPRSFRSVWASPFPSRLAALTRPNRVRHPTDWQFTSSCSPPRLTATQLESVTGRRAHASRGLSPLRLGTLPGALGTDLVSVRPANRSEPPVCEG